LHWAARAPDGTRVGFTYRERQTVFTPFAGVFGAILDPYFDPDPGVTHKLSIPEEHVFRGGILGGIGGEGVNPDRYFLTTPDGLVYDYDQFEGLGQITDPNKNTLTFTPTAITHSGGRVIAIDRDGQGRVTALHLPDGGVAVRYRYDARGDLVEVRQVTEHLPAEKAMTSTFTYRADRPHYLDEYFDPNGKRAVKTEYYPDGRVKAVIGPDGSRAEQAFDLINFSETVRDRRGNPTVVTYNDRGNVTKTVQPTEFGDVVVQTYYDDPANPDKETKVVNPRGVATTKTYDGRGNLLTEMTPDGTTAYRFDDRNKLTRVTDPLGRVTAYDYSPAGNLVRVVNPLGDSSTFTYDGSGRVKTFTDFAGNTTKFQDYCACGRPLTTINPDGSVRKIETNGYSQVTKVTDEEGNVTENGYDVQGRLVWVKDGEGNKTRYEYEGANQVRVIDPLGHVTVHGYDDGGRKNYIRDAEGGETFFTYDPNGNLETVKDPVGNVTKFVYDKANRLMAEYELFDPQDPPRLNEYDAAGNKTKATDHNGRVRTFEYDPMNRVTAERWLAADGSVVRVIGSKYDAVGNLVETSDPDAKLTYTYDKLDRVKTTTTEYPGTNVAAVTLTYGYDKNGNRTSVVDDAGLRVDSHYGDRNQLVWRTWQGGGIDPVRVEFDYFKNGERKSLGRFADLTGTVNVGLTDYTYFKNGLSKTIDHRNGTGAPLVGYGYQYDDAGRLVRETHHGDTYVYGYDKTGQLTAVAKNGSPFESFTYDRNGNRIAVTGPTAGTYVTGPGNRYTTDGTFDYAYDAEGNLRAKTEAATGVVTEYNWDYRNRLVRVDDMRADGVRATTYKYDPLGRQIGDNDRGTTGRFYHGHELWSIVAASGDREYHLQGDRPDEVLGVVSPGSERWLLSDRLQTPRDTLDPGAAQTSPSAELTAFGFPISADMATPYGLTGQPFDATTGLADYRFRTYDPRSGRFLSVDPLGLSSGDTNFYRYTFNAPVSYTDPLGLFAIEYLAAVRLTLGGGGGSEFRDDFKLPGALEPAGAIVGFVHGYAAATFSFLGEFLTDGDYYGAIARAQSAVKAIEKLLRLGSKYIDDKRAFVGGGGFLAGYLDGFDPRVEFGFFIGDTLGTLARFSLEVSDGVVRFAGKPLGGFSRGANTFFDSLR
jgi:RHS repeat-associated protein